MEMSEDLYVAHGDVHNFGALHVLQEGWSGNQLLFDSRT